MIAAKGNVNKKTKPLKNAATTIADAKKNRKQSIVKTEIGYGGIAHTCSKRKREGHKDRAKKQARLPIFR